MTEEDYFSELEQISAEETERSKIAESLTVLVWLARTFSLELELRQLKVNEAAELLEDIEEAIKDTISLYLSSKA